MAHNTSDILTAYKAEVATLQEFGVGNTRIAVTLVSFTLMLPLKYNKTSTKSSEERWNTIPIYDIKESNYGSEGISWFYKDQRLTKWCIELTKFTFSAFDFQLWEQHLFLYVGRFQLRWKFSCLSASLWKFLNYIPNIYSLLAGHDRNLMNSYKIKKTNTFPHQNWQLQTCK